MRRKWVVIYDSDLFRRTGDLSFCLGYENRHINIATLIGGILR